MKYDDLNRNREFFSHTLTNFKLTNENDNNNNNNGYDDSVDRNGIYKAAFVCSFHCNCKLDTCKANGCVPGGPTCATPCVFAKNDS